MEARVLASVIGKIISMGLALGLVSRFRTRSMYALLGARLAWCSILPLSEEARSEMEFWYASVNEVNSQPIRRSPGAVKIVFSDASCTGYGGYTVEHGMQVVNGVWTTVEAIQSSTWRELVAVGRVLEAMASKLRNTRIRWFTDNQNVGRILAVGSGKGHLQAEAVKIFNLCRSHALCIEPEWIPREQNEIADYLSRRVDCDDWFINPLVFKQIELLWGPHTVDRFASHLNAQLPRLTPGFYAQELRP